MNEEQQQTPKVSRLKQNILQKKADKIISLIEDNFFNDDKRKTLIITPGQRTWPKINRDICTLLSAPKRDWVAIPLIIKTNEIERVEFVLATKNSYDCWNVWESIITAQFDNFKKGQLNPYQLWVLQHMLNVSANLKIELEKISHVQLPQKTMLSVLQTALESESAKDKNYIRIPKQIDEAIRKAN